MKNLFTKSKKWFLGMGMALIIPMVLFSCLHLRTVYYPEVVKTNETFEVKMVADMRNSLDGTNTDRNGYGFVGVLLPVGWTIDEESIVYDYTGLGVAGIEAPAGPLNGAPYDYETKTGKLLLNQEMTDYCIELDPENWGEEYYWQGFRTDERLRSGNMDSIVIRFNVKVNDQVGDYQMLVGIQECSYDKDGKVEGDAGNTLMDNKGDGPFYKTGTPSSDEYSKEYLSIKVEQGTGSNFIYSQKDKENYTITPIGNGKLRVNLQNELKKGATAIVYDMNGKQISSQQLTQMENTLDAILNPGVYFVAVQKDGVRSSKKVVVK